MNDFIENQIEMLLLAAVTAPPVLAAQMYESVARLSKMQEEKKAEEDLTLPSVKNGRIAYPKE